MPPESYFTPDDAPPVTANSRFRWLPWAVGVWLFICTAMMVRTYLMPQRQTVYNDYSRAGRHWWTATDAYELPRDTDGHPLPIQSTYRYSPLFSACSVVLAPIPDQWGGVLWRLFSFGCYAAVLACFWREVIPGTARLGERSSALWWLLLLPLSLPSMNNGQVNVLMTAMMLAAGVAVMRERWNLAALALAAAFFMKLYPVAVVMLFILVYPRQLGWRFALAMVVGALLPFALQKPSYVLSAYESWYYLLTLDDRSEWALAYGYRDFNMLVRWLGLPITKYWNMLAQLAGAGVAAGICLWGRLSGWPKQQLVHAVVVLGCCWIIVFGPATESCTYILLAPGLAWAMVDAYAHRGVWARALLTLLVAMFLANGIANWFPEGRNWFYVFQPLGALIFFVERCCYVMYSQSRLRLGIGHTPSRKRVRAVACTCLVVCLLLEQPLFVWSQSASTPVPESEQRRGIVIVIGGVGGLDLLSNSAHSVLPKAGVKHEIVEFCWTHGKGKPFKDLQDSVNLRAKAEELAEYIRRLKAEDPDRIIIIVAKSGGTGVALCAAEMLPANMLERIILLSAAVSPSHDLRRALQATRGEIVSFYSPYDQFILNFGTRHFGTIDRVYGPGAGLYGFRLPDINQLSDDDRALLRRVVQIPWNSRMLLELHSGAHVGTSLPGFLAGEVAPWLR